MSGPRELASASAARLSGDDYQHLYTLMHAVRLLRDDVWGVTRVRMEVGGAGNVDDLIVEHGDRPPLYHQVKFSRRAGDEPLDHTWFTEAGDAKRSPLQRFHDSYTQLTVGDDRPQMALVTNRLPARNDPILRHVEGRDGRLVPRLVIPTAGSESGRLRRAWAEHLDLSEDELYELLDHLRIRAGSGSFEEMQGRCADVMLAAGLRADPDAVMLGYGVMRNLIEEGCDELDADAMRELVAQHKLEATRGTASLLVQAIDRAPYPESATVALDWVDYFEGDEPRARRQLRDPEAAITEMEADLVAARQRIRAAGFDRVLIGGAFRLDVGFAIGAALSDLAGFELTVTQGGQRWGTEGETTPFTLRAEEHALDLGDDLAVCLSISNDIADDVLEFVSGLPVKQLTTLTPESGPSRQSVDGAASARGAAQAVLDAVRDASRAHSRIHLFQSVPNGVSVMLGHVWNRVPPTRLYADGSPGYTPTLLIAG